ncbi:MULTISPECIES: hypothetical protein [Catenuloplanes]|uniref:Uncharacterized protein n=1 Tax=Catenuloplanes niger TaxID=587534 RepID=A0AAE4CT31_9ACTN|nr:hypothetical protein [Catenuloplanes niger]MDR7320324.1 hypothetical protein [Catenuloplanes niger]
MPGDLESGWTDEPTRMERFTNTAQNLGSFILRAVKENPERSAQLVSSAATFASTMANRYDKGRIAEPTADVANVAASLGVSASHGVQRRREGVLEHPVYVSASLLSATLSVTRACINFAGETNAVKDAKFAIDMAQFATQMVKWASEPKNREKADPPTEEQARHAEQLNERAVRMTPPTGTVGLPIPEAAMTRSVGASSWSAASALEEGTASRIRHPYADPLANPRGNGQRM